MVKENRAEANPNPEQMETLLWHGKLLIIYHIRKANYVSKERVPLGMESINYNIVILGCYNYKFNRSVSGKQKSLLHVAFAQSNR